MCALLLRLVAAINETMRYKRVPLHLQRRVHRFYEFMWLVHGALSKCPLQ